ncbi:MAG: hypothetical protein ACP5D2_02165 [Candidatus Nanoarchaeia archaeon]
MYSDGKRGMAIWELAGIILAIILLVLGVAAIIILLKGKAFGEEGLLAVIKDFLRFG